MYTVFTEKGFLPESNLQIYDIKEFLVLHYIFCHALTNCLSDLFFVVLQFFRKLF